MSKKALVQTVSIISIVASMSLPAFAATFTPTTILQHTTHRTRSIWLSKIARFFTRSTDKKAEYTQGITNTLLIQTLSEEAAGNSKAALRDELQYEQESTRLSDYIHTLQQSIRTNDDQSKLQGMVNDRAIELRALEAETEQNVEAELHVKLARHKPKLTIELTDTLEHTSSTDQATWLAELINAFTSADLSSVDELAHHLALTAAIDNTSTDTRLKNALEAADNVILGNQQSLTEAEANDLADQLELTVDETHSLVDLEKLTDHVQDTAKITLLATVDRISKKIAESKDVDSAIQALLKESEHSAELQTKILDHINEHANETTKRSIESFRHQVEQNNEQAKQAIEMIQHAQEKASEAAKQSEEKHNRTQNQETRSSNDSSKISESQDHSNTDTEVDRETIEIEVKNGAFDGNTSFSLRSGTVVTVKFKVDDNTARILTLSNGQTSDPIANKEVALASFTLTTPVTFTVSGVSGTGTIGLK